MINKVLIAEDHESANISVQKTLGELKIEEVDYAYYCDDALKKIHNGVQINQPYDLLITDLYFEEDRVAQQINDGTALIAAARSIQPALKVLVFSMENRPAIIERLYGQLEIDGYVRKARHDARELRSAMECLEQGQRYQPRHLIQVINQKNSYAFTKRDIAIISLLADGKRQKEMPQLLEQMQLLPAGLSSIEKSLNQMREVYGFSSNEQLVAFCKDMGII